VRSGENTPAWYLVDHLRRILSGPFTDRSQTGTQARYRPGMSLPPDDDELWAAYGVWADDGTIELRAAPADRAWEAHLSGQLDRLPIDPGPDAGHQLREFTALVATALVAAGFDLHDCTGRVHDRALGGVCVTAVAGDPTYGPGVRVRWNQHDRVTVDRAHTPEQQDAVEETMNAALADVLGALGFAVAEYGTPGDVMVTWVDPADNSQ
jgi:hypothetical protein